MVEQRPLVFGQPKEPALLNRPLNRRAVRRELCAVFGADEFVRLVISLVADRVPTFIAIEVKVSPLLHRLPDRSALSIMILLRSANESIVRHLKHIAHVLKK